MHEIGITVIQNGASRVSIVVLNWNQPDYTLRCLESLKALDYPNCDIIVVDNGSTDGSPDVIESQHLDVTLIRNIENLGFCEGNNVGIQVAMESGCDFIFVLNNDTHVDKDCVSHLVEVCEGDPQIGAAAPKIYFWDEPARLWFFGAKVNRNRGAIEHFGWRDLDRGQYASVIDTDYATGCALFVRREVVEETGMFDPDYFANHEDVDWGIRIRDHGYRIVCIPQSVVWHKVAVSAGGLGSPFYLYYRSRNKLLFVRKQHRDPMSLFDIASIVWFYIRYIGYHGVLQHNPRGAWAILKGMIAFARGDTGKGNSPPK